MIKVLKKLFLFFYIALLSSDGYAQKEAIIMGKIEDAPSPNIFIEYKKNLFTLDNGIYEGFVDLNNLFGFRVNLREPRSVVLKYGNNNIRLFMSPGDTLILSFEGKSMMSTLKFDGKNAAANRFLLDFDKRFPAFEDEKALNYAQFSGKTLDFKTFVDTSHAAQMAFWDKYPASQKSDFSKSFHNYITADLSYWRFFHLMNFYKKAGFNNSKIADEPGKGYFDFLNGLELSNPNALNNTYYLKFLNLYLDYWYQKHKNTIGALPLDTEVEKQSIVQTVRPRNDRLEVWENPLSSRNIVAVLSKNEQAYSQYLTTNEPLSFKIGDVFVYDYFLKIKTFDDRMGWVPHSYVEISEKQIIQRYVYPRFCFDTATVLCGLDTLLIGKSLYFAALQDLILSTSTISKEEMVQKSEIFISQNREFKEYNDILRGVLKSVETDRDNLMKRIIVPDDCMVEYFNLNQLFFDKNLSAQFGEQKTGAQPMIWSADPFSELNNSSNKSEVMDYHTGKPFIFKGLVINENIPPFKLIDINGTEIRQQDLLGKVIYIDFWATWCSPCQAQLTHSQGLFEKYKDNKDIVFLYISVDTEKEEWKAYLRDNKMKGLQVNEATIIPLNFMIQGLPNFFIIDKNGRVAYNSRISTKIDAESMIQYLLGSK